MRRARDLLDRFAPLVRVELAALPLGICLLAVLTTLDVLAGRHSVLTGIYLLVPFLMALIGGRWSTAVAAVLTLILVAASGLWHQNFGSESYWLRLGVIAPASVFSVFAAWTRHDSRRSMRRFELLNDIAEFADGSLPLSLTIQRLTDVIVPELADICLIDVITEGDATRAAVRALGPSSEQIERRLERAEPILPKRLLGSGEPPFTPLFLPQLNEAVLKRTSSGEDEIRVLHQLGARSLIGVPLVSREQTLGLLVMAKASPGPRYRRDDLRFARVMSGRIALALDNAGLFSDLESVERRMDTVMATLGEAVIVHDSGGGLVYANTAAARLLGYGTPEELLATPPEKIRDRFDMYSEEGEPLPVQELGNRRVFDGGGSTETIVRAIERETGEEIWRLTKSRPIEGPDGRVLYVVTSISDVTELKRAEFAEGMLSRTGELVDSSIDYRETLRKVAQLAIPELADRCSVYMPLPDGSIEELSAAHEEPEHVTEAHRSSREHRISIEDDPRVAAVLRTGEQQILSNPDHALRSAARDERHLEILRGRDLGSLMLMPMRVGKEVLGVMALSNRSDRRPFDQFDRHLAERISARAAVALENARLATERMEVAQHLEEGLLPPHLPRITGWSAAALYRPAGAESEVGGDFYDTLEFEGGSMLIVGDVAGRGAPAAALTALARHTIRTAGILTGDPRVALRLLNGALLENESASLCSVAIAALHHGPRGRAEVAVAGHPPPLLIRGDRVEEIEAKGPLLGAFETAEWEIAELELERGEQLVLYTDGVTEARGPEDRFGESRLRAGLAGSPSPTAAIGRVEGELESFVAGELVDDAALLVVMRDPDVTAERAAQAAGVEV